MSAQTRIIALATSNAHKVREIAAVLTLPACEYRTMADLGITEEPVEDACSFEGNALIKARFVFERSRVFSGVPCATIADDSGLEVDALDGAPGIFSARYAGEGADDADNRRKLLEALRDTVPAHRTARFVCAMAFVDEDGHETMVRGTSEGTITLSPRGEGGFGYDPLFLPDDVSDGRTMAELSPAEKNAISHRGRALRALQAILMQRED
ncbi:MAG: RdgB/HAM1 family non-canonical purine NTP pyrophosphatase [Coriobacteriales bacterium]|jgi:XTP/dITP diphosphohydrolase|nr:RdgB/HAM1 family non-canonical purine NTP pyrophosphatase [Coriobacteriales bacterium]